MVVEPNIDVNKVAGRGEEGEYYDGFETQATQVVIKCYALIVI